MRIGTRTPIGNVDGFGVVTPGGQVGWVEEVWLDDDGATTALAVRLPSGERTWRIKPLFDDQELDSRAGGGPVYWEGAAEIEGGRGYLELTGYFRPLKL